MHLAILAQSMLYQKHVAKRRNSFKRILQLNFIATLAAKRGRKATGLTQIAEPCHLKD